MSREIEIVGLLIKLTNKTMLQKPKFYLIQALKFFSTTRKYQKPLFPISFRCRPLPFSEKSTKGPHSHINYRGNARIVFSFQPELYKKDLVRQSSADSSGGPEMEYCGKLHFALRYDKDVEGLIVKVRRNEPL